MIYDLELRYAGAQVTAKALLDTGNSVRDLYTGYPVVILTADVARRLTSRQIGAGSAYDADARQGGIALRLLPVRALTGEKYLPAFTADTASVSCEQSRKDLHKVSVAVTDDPLGEDRYQALIGEDFIT